MKKKMLGIFLCTALAVTMAAGCTKKNEVLESSQAAAAAEGAVSIHTRPAAGEPPGPPCGAAAFQRGGVGPARPLIAAESGPPLAPG